MARIAWTMTAAYLILAAATWAMSWLPADEEDAATETAAKPAEALS